MNPNRTSSSSSSGPSVNSKDHSEFSPNMEDFTDQVDRMNIGGPVDEIADSLTDLALKAASETVEGGLATDDDTSNFDRSSDELVDYASQFALGVAPEDLEYLSKIDIEATSGLTEHGLALDYEPSNLQFFHTLDCGHPYYDESFHAIPCGSSCAANCPGRSPQTDTDDFYVCEICADAAGKLIAAAAEDQGADNNLGHFDEGTSEEIDGPLDNPADSLYEGPILDEEYDILGPEHTCADAFSFDSDYYNTLLLRFEGQKTVYDKYFEDCKACVEESKLLTESNPKPEASSPKLQTVEENPDPSLDYELSLFAAQAKGTVGTVWSPTMPPPPQPRTGALRRTEDGSPDYAFQASPAYTLTCPVGIPEGKYITPAEAAKFRKNQPGNLLETLKRGDRDLVIPKKPGVQLEPHGKEQK
ncbi:hypothetical protein BU16DRAFT_593111 [Lophium mytilinum]|uniref:4Fe-4S ferredoxin-type domain-containing protein n=1 Tax=Lophium mytilinum TaxID=390894 RepID=A0A6A6QHN5_9PEZI|nr:hypothetical protein BU16DRAFT_593111 [Lophium mytilinum]